MRLTLKRRDGGQVLNRPPRASQLFAARYLKRIACRNPRGVDFSKHDAHGGELGQRTRRALRLRSSVVGAPLEQVRAAPNVAIGKREESFPIKIGAQIFIAKIGS